MKYRPSPLLLKLLSTHFAELVMTHQRSWDAIIPIPTTAEMFAKRMFHQCLSLSNAASKASNRTPVLQALRRRRKAQQQATLRLKSRLENVVDLFEVTYSIKGKRILLVDDVITTGATTAAATRSLLDAGAQCVDIYSLARSCNWSRFRYRIYDRFGV